MSAHTTQLKLYRRLVLAVLGGTLFLLLLAIAFNWFMDPYGVYGAPRIKGINAVKARAHKNSRFLKAMAIYDRKPQQLIVGTSRAEYGLDPEHPGWRTDEFGECYNAALSGANIYEMKRFFEHAAAVGNLKRAVAAVDFFSFNIYSRDGLGDTDNFLAVERDGSENTTIDYLWLKYRNLPSLDMMRISYATFQRQDRIELLTDKGARVDGDISQEIIGAGGNRAAFENNVRTYYGFGYLPRPYKAFAFRYDQSVSAHLPNPDNVEDTFAYFRTIVALAYKKNIDLKVVISPSHAWQWEIIRAAGLWDRFEQWKRTMTEIISDEAQKASAAPFPLWDFADFSAPTLEEVPERGSTRLMQNYWESSHYRRELGNRVLNKIFGLSEDSEFGLLLSDENLDSCLAMIRKREEEYADSHPEDVATIRRIWQEEAVKTR